MYEKFSIGTGDMVKNAINYIYPDAPKKGENARFPKGNIESVRVIRSKDDFTKLEIITSVSNSTKKTSDYATWIFSDTAVAGLYDVKVNDPATLGANAYDKFHDQVLDKSEDFMNYLNEIGAVKSNNVLENYLKAKSEREM